jgi:hypothetical protein
MTSFAMNSASEITAGERDLRRRFEQWLPEVVGDPMTHARFVNTLSLLEHIGSVKIARTQSGEKITATALQHLAEETRHAYVLKRITRAIWPEVARDYGSARLLAGESARGYFSRLDAGVRQYVRRELEPELQSPAAYFLVTWLVELRASWLYPAYQGVLGAFGLRHSVRSIIGEEERHLQEICEGLQRLGVADNVGLPSLVNYEHGLFERLASKMMAATGEKLP